MKAGHFPLKIGSKQPSIESCQSLLFDWMLLWCNNDGSDPPLRGTSPSKMQRTGCQRGRCTSELFTISSLANVVFCGWSKKLAASIWEMLAAAVDLSDAVDTILAEVQIVQQDKSADYQPLGKAQRFINDAIKLLDPLQAAPGMDIQEEEWAASAREQILTAKAQLDCHISQLETSPDSTFYPALTQAAATLYTAVETLNQLWAKICCHTKMEANEMHSAGRVRTYSTVAYDRLCEHARDLGISLPELPDPPVSLPPLLQAMQERNARLDALWEEVGTQYPSLLELSESLDKAIDAIEILWEKNTAQPAEHDHLVWLANARAAVQASRCQMEGLVLVLAGDFPDEPPIVTAAAGSANVFPLPTGSDDTPA